MNEEKLIKLNVNITKEERLKIICLNVYPIKLEEKTNPKVNWRKEKIIMRAELKIIEKRQTIGKNKATTGYQKD